MSNVKGNELGKVERRVESKEGYIAVVYTVPNADGKCGQLAALTEKAVQKADLVSSCNAHSVEQRTFNTTVTRSRVSS